MKRILSLALLALTLSGGVALADRDRGRGRDTSHRSGGTIVTPTYRGHDRVRDDDRRHDRRWENRRHDKHRHDRVVRVQRARPTFRNNRFYFAGGHYQAYQRPVIQYRYRNYYQRPALVVENIQPVSGYLWVQGNWRWDGYEWQWMPGHYEVDARYQDAYQDAYDDAYGDAYDGGYDEASSYPGPSYGGGISVHGNWNF